MLVTCHAMMNFAENALMFSCIHAYMWVWITIEVQRYQICFPPFLLKFHLIADIKSLIVDLLKKISSDCWRIPFCSLMQVVNSTYALWTWHRNQDTYKDDSRGDQIYIVRQPELCLPSSTSKVTSISSIWFQFYYFLFVSFPYNYVHMVLFQWKIMCLPL